ncbi:AAA family ATPase [bacterium]|nr:AAA family ATPase [bacterium]
MHVIEREQLEVLSKRLNDEPRRFIQVLFGPRQVGKTTIVKQFIKKTQIPCLLISADAAPNNDQGWISLQWDNARLKYQANEQKELIFIIDEIQKIANWSEQIKAEWDADSLNDVNIKVVLLGSSRLMLQQGLSESLAGRFESIYVGHWSLTEMQNAFDLNADAYLWFGGYPGAASLINDEERWKNYITDSLIETTINRDILLLTRVDKPALLRRLLELGSIYSGQVLALNKMLGQLVDAGNTTTLSNYLQLLGTAGLLGGLAKYSPNTIRQRAASPKFQVHNMAFMSALQPKDFAQIRTDLPAWGRWVESAVGAHLVNATFKDGLKLYYWREGNLEVDFVLEYKGLAIAIEVKSGYAKNTEGLVKFKSKFNPHSTLIIGKGGLPWEDFLKLNPKSLF